MTSKFINIVLLTALSALFSFQLAPFKSTQLTYPRVKQAYEKNWSGLQARLQKSGINKDNFEIYIRIFKQEKLLQVYLKNSGAEKFTLFKNYPICASSGVPGPKRKQGDGQVPEGFYRVESLNPNSNYHLSLKINYPNRSDEILRTDKDPGGDIMIHGNCVTIGCVPIQDEPIEELYVLCVEAMNRKKMIRTEIYPFRFDEKNQGLVAETGPQLQAFWNQLKQGWLYFEASQTLPMVTIDNSGKYIFKPGS